jgi:hypothetical protein
MKKVRQAAGEEVQYIRIEHQKENFQFTWKDINFTKESPDKKVKRYTANDEVHVDSRIIEKDKAH